MMKKIMILMVILIATSSSVQAQKNADGLEGLTVEFYKLYNIEELEKYYTSSGLDEAMEYLTIKDYVVALVKGEVKWDFQSIVAQLKEILFKELSISLDLLAQIVFLSIMAAILTNLSSSFGKSQVANIAFYVIYFVLIGLIANSIFASVTLATDTIDSMVVFLKAILPTMFLLLASVGAIVSSSMLSPVILYVVGFIGTVVKSVVYPLIISSAVVTLINHLSAEIKLSNLAKLLKDIALGVLGFLFVLFLGLVSIQGMAVASLDGVTAKTAKYAIDNFIPFVGGFLADSFDTVISASNIIKNGIGGLGLLIITAIIVMPIVKMVVLFLLFRISAAIIQPISDDRIVKCLWDMGSYMFLIMSCIIIVAVMFFIALSVIVLLGDMTIMYR